MVNQETLTFVYQYLHKKLPSVFKNYFLHRHDPTEMIMEQRKRRFQIPIHSHDIGASTIKVVGSKILNEKATKLNLNNKIKTFRAKVKQMYIPYPEKKIIWKTIALILITDILL